ncbi:hypothetical protein, partial [Acinetobacter baumannii]|uniref:hypothetical protein n=1 Tax=Acinetobacter baumannii TaxID=470 RepID=UPI00344E6BA2
RLKSYCRTAGNLNRIKKWRSADAYGLTGLIHFILRAIALHPCVLKIPFFSVKNSFFLIFLMNA